MNNKSSSGKTTQSFNGMPERVKLLTIGLLLLVSTSAGFVGGWLGAESRDNQNDFTNTREVRQVVSNESELINQIAEEVGPGVVSVNVVTQGQARDFFGFGQNIQQQSAGTGFIISADGTVVTNRHVVPEGATDVSVTLADGTLLEDVEIIGRTGSSDPLDIAFLRINDSQGKDLQPVKIGDSSKVKVGDRVVAIGNALGQFQNSVTSGIISGYGRSIEAGNAQSSETLQNLFQTDAAINQGNSGGPLVNINGEVIGINTAVAGRAENIGFSIPVNDVKGLIKSVSEKGELLRPYLGVRYVSLTDDLAFQFGVDVKRGAFIVPSGARSRSIIQDSPADKAGLKERDVITKINDIEISENNSLTSILGQYSVDDKVVLSVVRDGEELEIEVTLEAAPTS